MRLPSQNIYGFWTLLPLGVHAAAVLLLMRFSPGKGQRNIWRKATTATSAQLPASVKLPLQRFDDVKLLVACMAWPPSVFVSDATDTQGTNISLKLPYLGYLDSGTNHYISERLKACQWP